MRARSRAYLPYQAKRDICPSRDDAQPHIYRTGDVLCTFCYAPGGPTMLDLWRNGVEGWRVA